MLRKLVLFVLVMFASTKVLPCSIIPNTFCKSIQINAEHVIVTGKIISKDIDGLDLEVIDVLRGDESRKVIRIWDGEDFDCNGPWSMSAEYIGNVSDTVIISLPLIEEVISPWDVVGDYRRPNPYFHTPELRVKNGKAHGLIQGDAIAPAEYNLWEIDYSKIKESIILNGVCKDLISNVEDVFFEDITITNPVTTYLELKNASVNQIRTLSLYTINSEKVISRKVETSADLKIDLINEPPALYILEVISENGYRKAFTIIKQ